MGVAVPLRLMAMPLAVRVDGPSMVGTMRVQMVPVVVRVSVFVLQRLVVMRMAVGLQQMQHHPD